MTERAYGDGDATFHALGGEAGIQALVNAFYDTMATDPAYHRLHEMHPDPDDARERLWRFLCAWTGGPRRYSEKYGPISIPKVHAHLDVSEVERDMWLSCMMDALTQQECPQDLKDYLRVQFFFPADRVRQVSQARQAQDKA